jgi:hypothetical protein
MALGLLGAALGCHHTAGVCDCDDHGSTALAQPALGSVPVLRPQPVKDMPKATDTKPAQ